MPRLACRLTAALRLRRRHRRDGKLHDAPVAVGDELMALPSRTVCRVRGIQVHGDTPRALPGNAWRSTWLVTVSRHLTAARCWAWQTVLVRRYAL